MAVGHSLLVWICISGLGTEPPYSKYGAIFVFLKRARFFSGVCGRLWSSLPSCLAQELANGRFVFLGTVVRSPWNGKRPRTQ